MKTKILIFIIIICTNKVSAEGWKKINTGFSNNFYSIYFINDNTGWMCGQGGLIIKTTDSGISWNKQDSGKVKNFRKIQFIDNLNGWACSDSGNLYESKDSGINWNFKVNIFSSIEMDNPKLGDIQFIDNLIVYACSNNYLNIIKSTDGGNTWFLIKNETATGLGFYSLNFINSNEGWACGSGSRIFRTTNGGDSWRDQTNNGNIVNPTWYSIFADDKDYVFFVGTDYYISGSRKGGESWGTIYKKIGTGSGIFRSGCSISHSYNWVAGDGGVIGKINYETGTPAAEQYKELAVLGDNLNDIFFIDTVKGWVCGDNGVFYISTSGGNVSVDYQISKCNKEILVFPNPATSFVNMKFEKEFLNISISMYSINGELIVPLTSYSSVNSILFNLENIPTGTYYLNILTENTETFVIPLIINN